MKRSLGFALIITALALGSASVAVAGTGNIEQLAWQFRLGGWMDQLANWMAAGQGPGNCQGGGDCDQDRTGDRLRTRDRIHDPALDAIRDRDRDRDRLQDPGTADRTMIGQRDHSGDCPYGN